MKKNIALLTAMLLLTGCTWKFSAPVSIDNSSVTTTAPQTEKTTTSCTTASESETSAEPLGTEPIFTAETTPTEESDGAEKPEGLPVRVQFLEDAQITGEFDEFNPIDDESAVKVVFTTEKTVTDFKVLSISMQDNDDSGSFTFSAEELYSMPELTPDRPLEAGMQFIGTVPNNGIAFIDPNGEVKYFAVDMSGRDGSLFLCEIRVV